MTASRAAGCGGTIAWTTESPAVIGSAMRISGMRVAAATVKAIGTSRTKPTSKKTGNPTISATVIIAQSARRGPKTLTSVAEIRSAPPDSTMILPRIDPSPTTSAI